MVSGLKNIETIESPFRRFVTTIGVFPTAFTDAMTYYECLAYLVKYLEDSVVPAVNENAEALKELQDYVVHYFDNLDVQEEINNKLDQMAEAGTLQEIIGDYLNATAVWGFDNVAGMKASTNLINGSYAKTLGYHTKNDGGGATYKIRTITNDDVVDEMTIIEISDSGNTLIAELILPDVVTPEMCGAYGDGIHIDNVSLNKAFSLGKKVILNKVYKVEATSDNPTVINVPSDAVIEFNGGHIQLSPNNLDSYKILNIDNVENVKIYGNGSIIGDKDTHTGSSGEWGNNISITKSSNIEISGINVTKAWGDGIYIGSDNVSIPKNIMIHNCDISDNGRNNISVVAGDTIYLSDLIVNKADRTAPEFGIDIEPNDNDLDYVKNIRITNCTALDNGNQGIGVILYNDNSLVNDVYIDGLTTNTNVDFSITNTNSNLTAKNLALKVKSGVQNVINGKCANGSTQNIQATMYGVNANTVPVIYSEAMNNVTLDIDLYGSAIARTGSIYGTPTGGISNNIAKFKSHITQNFSNDTSQNTEIFDQYEFIPLGMPDATTITTFPAYGGSVNITADGANGVVFKAAYTQKGTRFIVKNSSNATQPVRAHTTHNLASGHLGVYEALSFGVISNIADITL